MDEKLKLELEQKVHINFCWWYKYCPPPLSPCIYLQLLLSVYMIYDIIFVKISCTIHNYRISKQNNSWRKFRSWHKQS
jgi:hypothetical protein